MPFIAPSDLTPFATIATTKAEAMIADAEAQAILAAPCIPDLLTVPDGETDADKARREAKIAAVKAVLRAAILRWNEAGAGVIQTTMAGPFSQTQQVQGRRAMFWPSEITDLQAVCKGADAGKAFAVDTAPSDLAYHAPWCSLAMGATYCSCGASIAGFPIYEQV